MDGIGDPAASVSGPVDVMSDGKQDALSALSSAAILAALRSTVPAPSCSMPAVSVTARWAELRRRSMCHAAVGIVDGRANHCCQQTVASGPTNVARTGRTVPAGGLNVAGRSKFSVTPFLNRVPPSSVIAVGSTRSPPNGTTPLLSSQLLSSGVTAGGAKPSLIEPRMLRSPAAADRQRARLAKTVQRRIGAVRTRAITITGQIDIAGDGESRRSDCPR